MFVKSAQKRERHLDRNAPIQTMACGAQQCAAHSLHRLTHERPAADSPSAEPTRRWCSDRGKDRVNVTGKSTRAVGLHPSMGTWPAQHRSGMQVEKGDCTSHPAEPMAVA